MIRFNKPYVGNDELEKIQELFSSGSLSGDGRFTKKCSAFFAENYGFKHNFLTTSATDALEMAAILLDIKPGDEVIVPSFTFSSSPNAFLLRGAKIIFADSHSRQPNIDEGSIASLITKKTKAIVPVHYSGVACEMDSIRAIAKNKNIAIVEDAAQGLASRYKGKETLGSIGDFGAISFHETKNITCGEGGLLIVKDEMHAKRAEYIREKGTNRSSFFRGEIDKYGWVDVGSSFLPSDILAAILYAQLEKVGEIQAKRIAVWERYNSLLQPIVEKGFSLPFIPEYGEINGHLFYLVCPSLDIRSALINFLKENGIKAPFHYQPLHRSQYYMKNNEERPELPNAVKYGERLLRLPLYAGLQEEDVNYIANKVLSFISKL